MLHHPVPGRIAALLMAMSALAAPAAAAEARPGAGASVRACPALGAGFYALPGSDTCVKIGGRARYESGYASSAPRGAASTGSRATGMAFVDSRTQTEAGPLRAYVRVGVSRGLGATPPGLTSR
ncbi:porin [Alsobacter sp. KACC 23698]|uniref:Porin n=1 Tax=Alsobacter sp. KACC 23698 TaxID=3149229 RepID=A0AAU7JJ89_9HYPH